MHETEKEAVRQTAPRLRSRRILLAVAAVVVAASVLAIVWYVRHTSPPEPPTPDLTDADPDLVNAIQRARDEVCKTPRSSRAWGRFGMVLAANGFRAEALVALAEAERLDPKEPRWPYLQGVTLQRGNPDQALPKLRRAVELSHETAPRLRLAELLIPADQLDRAEALLGEVEQAEPGNVRAELDLALVARNRGQLATCLEHLRRAEQGPLGRRKAAAALRAEVYTLQDRDKDAERERQAMLDLPDDPLWPDPYLDESQALRVGKQADVEHANALRYSGRLPEAVDLYRKILARDPNYDLAWLGLGQAMFELRDYPQAERAYREAVRCGKDAFEAHYRLGVVLYRQRDRQRGTLDEAVKQFRAAIACSPRVSAAHFRLGLCLEDLDDRPGAMAAYREALRCRPDYPDAHRALGQLLTEAGREAAVAAAVARLGGAPTAVDIALAIRAEAREHLRDAVRLAPKDGAAGKALDRLATEFPVGRSP
jgi:tetratricopeptide (TPR) repeat protein